jgi:Ca2+-binding RTX toxin-like protein
MTRRISVRLFVGGVVVLVVATLASAITAANTVPASRVGNPTQAISLDDLKPSQCSAVTGMGLITGSGVITGTVGNDLILGSPGIDAIDGKNGNDCLVGGGSGDSLDGGAGTGDVCLGGPGTDSFARCETQVQ